MKDQFHDWFSRVFVINLDKRTDRWCETVEELSNSGIEPSRIERFPGVEHPGGGHHGCTQAHRNLLRKVSEGPWERVLVFEDDMAAITTQHLLNAGFQHHQAPYFWHRSIMDGNGNIVQRFNAMAQDIPDEWDVLYLGAGYGEAPISRHSKHCVRCAGMLTTGSYGITRKFADIWTEEMDRLFPNNLHPGPIDSQFSRFARRYLFYCLQPRLVFQRKSLSNITGETNSHLDSMTNPNHEAMA